jgi:hypothetical protein
MKGKVPVLGLDLAVCSGMADEPDPGLLTLALEQDRPMILERWMTAFHERSWRARGAVGGTATPPGTGSTALEQQPQRVMALLRERCDHLLFTLDGGLAQLERPTPGAPELREPIQLLSFTAGWMAGVGFQAGDALALVQGLEAILGPRLERGLLEALEVTACEAHQAAMGQAAEARFRDAMSKAQVVCSLGEAQPCLFLVGEPDRPALDDAVGRLMTLAVMRGARRVLVDCATLASPARILPDLVEILLGYLEEIPMDAVVSALPEELAEPRRALEDAGVTLARDVGEALEP